MAAMLDYQAFANFELNHSAHRKLDRELRATDLALQAWSPWARPRYTAGYPTRSITERANEGGILARDFTIQPSPEWPRVAVDVDAQVARLPTRHMAAVFAAYFHAGLPAEQRAAIYAELAKHLARTRPTLVACRQPLGPGGYRDNLDRARWILKVLLRL